MDIDEQEQRAVEVAMAVDPESSALGAAQPSASILPIAGPSSSTSAPASLMPPPASVVPQDLSVIASLIEKHEVVGSLPPLRNTASEQRRLVEAGAAAIEVDSESSSEFESDSDASDAGDIPVPAAMTAAEHAAFRAQIEVMAGAGAGEGESEGEAAYDSSPYASSDDEYEHYIHPDLMEDDEDDVPTTGPDGLMTAHETALPPVAQPPVARLPEGQSLSLAGDVVSWMREKKVEAWIEQQAQHGQQEQVVAVAKAQAEAGSSTATEVEAVSESMDSEAVRAAAAPDPEGAAPAQEPLPPPADKKAELPKFVSAGTVIVRAMQSNPAAGGGGWLEEGSVLCFADGRVLGAVAETFGPLTSPFYQIRLPPPPHPYPSPSSLGPGTRLFYANDPAYRSFVNMVALRDPRLKGSDASNVYDEEVGEDEAEWSDDEAEAEARARRKQKRAGSRAPSRAGSVGVGSSVAGTTTTPRVAPHGLPPRPHFDYAPDDVGSVHGDVEWEAASDAGSTVSTASARRAVAYDDLESGDAAAGGSPSPSAPVPPGQPFAGPPFQQPYAAGAPFALAPQAFGYPHQPGFYMPQAFSAQPGAVGGYNPAQPGGGMGTPQMYAPPAPMPMGQPQPQPHPAAFQQRPTGAPPLPPMPRGQAPAINPRFAAQYGWQTGGGFGQ
ncbi:hypothetical protein Q5752_003435 [Cryptotrichosporon argae]